MFDSCRQRLACEIFFFLFLADLSEHCGILSNISGLGQVSTHSSTETLNLNTKHWKMFWPKVNEFLISMVYAWQAQQMGSVSKHPLWPGGFSCSCTGASHKHTNEILTEIKQNTAIRFQSGPNLLLYLGKSFVIMKRMPQRMNKIRASQKDGGWGVFAEQVG